jgi:hypothetical protein
MENKESIKEQVREHYAHQAERVRQTGSKASCGGSSCSDVITSNLDPITSNLYRDDETSGLPADAIAASLGCGNPTALAELKPGETVLDLGSGGGIDVLLSAPCWFERQGLRTGHDRRNARSGARESAQSRHSERRILEG